MNYRVDDIGRKFYINLVNMVFMLGFAFGGVLLAARADEFGRKPVMLFSLWLTAVSSIAITWSPNVKGRFHFHFPFSFQA